MDREPLITVGAITGAVTALIALVVAFGVDVTEDQQAAILGVVAVVAPAVVALWSRRKVTPLADPRDDDGTPLMRETEAVRLHVGPVVAQDPAKAAEAIRRAAGLHRAP